MGRLIIWGAGALGGRVARLWQDGDVLAYTRSTANHDALRSNRIRPAVGSPLNRLQEDDCLLLALPGHEVQGWALRELRQAQQSAVRRTVLVSTTGVYGRTPGKVDEETSPGSSARCQSIAAVEEEFLSWSGKQGVVLRMGGLYDDVRGPLAAVARRGAIRPGPAHVTLALIHYADAAAAVHAALTHATVEARYVAVTPPCPSRKEFYTTICAWLGMDAPVFTRPQANQGVAGALPEIDAAAEYDVGRLRRDLLPVPRYPDWRAIYKESRLHNPSRASGHTG